MESDKLIHDCIMDIRVMSVQWPQTLEVSQSVIDRLHRIKAEIDHLLPPEEEVKHFSRPIRKKPGSY